MQSSIRLSASWENSSRNIGIVSLFFFDCGGRYIRTRRILNFPCDTETSRCSKDVKLELEILVIVKAFRRSNATPPPFAFSRGTWMTLKSFNVFRISASEMLINATPNQNKNAEVLRKKSTRIVRELGSTQEEADTRQVLYTRTMQEEMDLLHWWFHLTIPMRSW